MLTIVSEHLHVEKPFYELGKYRLKHPLFILGGPVMKLSLSKKKHKLKGTIKWFGFTREMNLIIERKGELVFEIAFESVQIDVVCRFFKEDAFEGLIDTPIGHVTCIGRLVKRKK